MLIKIFGRNKHPFTRHWPENKDFRGKLSKNGLSFFFDRLVGMSANRAVVAYGLNNKIVGYFRFSFSPTSRTINAKGTWVDPQYRRKNLAADLWTAALRKFKPRKVAVFTVSRGGDRLIRSLAEKDYFKMIKWDHDSAVL